MGIFKRLADIHFHLGQSVDPHILWSIAHEQGIKLPSKDYQEFYNMITLNKPHISWSDYHKLFKWTELIQSSPMAMERSLYETVSGAFRVNGITLQEPGFCPMFRNRNGEQDLDHILLAALRGAERALIEFPKIHAGIILMLDRRLPYKINKIIAEKAIKYKNRGVIGIDIAGPNAAGFSYKDYVKLFRLVQEAGLKTTVHTGEDGTPEEMEEVISILPLNRVNHGIKAAYSKNIMRKLVKKNITLCICPSSNLKVGYIKDITHLKWTLQTLYENKVKFCINTDNPSMLKTTVLKEIQLIRDNNILSDEQIKETIDWAFESSFIDFKKQKESNLYL
ncbi:adenosine deaminase [Patescibacteria group bacterium]|nr:adenosine deaminase [Patescibacteria group bacterium]